MSKSRRGKKHPKGDWEPWNAYFLGQIETVLAVKRDLDHVTLWEGDDLDADDARKLANAKHNAREQLMSNITSDMSLLSKLCADHGNDQQLKRVIAWAKMLEEKGERK